MQGKAANFGAIARILDAIVSEVHLSGYRCGLGPAQWSALRFFGEVNAQSATVMSFASQNRITRGTASRTVASLVEKGLLERVPDKADRRSHRLILTARGTEMLEDDPIRQLEAAIGTLDSVSRDQLARTLFTIAPVLFDRSREQHTGVND